MKNNFSTNFYKAYTLWKDTLEDDVKYIDYKKSLQNLTSGTTSLSGTVGNKLLDLEWLERIENVLPFMDKAIRESRSFIEQRDEIVSIEKVKRVNTQSIRHLAQHTNLIARVEANNEVKPERILNIYYETNSSIYENRFLYTLLGRLNDFVERRYIELKNKDERIEIKYDINKTIRRKNKTAKMLLEFEYKTQSEDKEVDIRENVENLSGFSRIIRIRRIISDFYSLPLIKELHGVELVKPPIIQTNLLAKNVNFRNCVELWDYIARYNKPGFAYEDKEFSGKMPKKTSEDLADVFVFTNFLTEMTFNTALKRNIERQYKEEVTLEKQLEKEKQQLEKQRQQEELEAKIRDVLERKTTPLYKKIDLLEDKYKRLQFRHESLQYRHGVMIDAANDVMRQHRVIEKEQDSIRELKNTIMNIEEQIKQKNQAIYTARHELNKADYPITLERAEQKIKEQREQALKEKVLRYQQQKQEELKEAIKLYQQEKLKEFKNEILNYQEKEQTQFKALPVRINGYKEDEINVNAVSDDELEQQINSITEQEQEVYGAEQAKKEFTQDNVIKFKLPEDKYFEDKYLEEGELDNKEPEEELEKLLKMLKEMQGN
ncbi:MAG: hypothetical protein CVV59_01415 [Tenericutes bacterium HGW-Tenericutes-4]|nr:MAG: hypothetical protein CVV59_01415 [Tenericutes bacterium HGW-Tenericutes-4]